MQLTPREYFTIARGLEDHTDNTVFYVRATVRNARTDELLDTVNLTNQGDNHRYSYPWQVPADSSGQGFYILIRTSVYTDSAYTTKSSLYGDKYDTYLVADRMNPNLGMGGGGADVDYKRIQKMIREEIAGIKFPEIPALKEMDIKPFIDATDSLREAISGIELPKQVPTDLTAVLKKLDQTLAAASDKKLPAEFKEAMEGLRAYITDMFDAHTNASLAELESRINEIGSLLERIKEFFGKDMDALRKDVSEINAYLHEIQFVALPEKPKQEN